MSKATDDLADALIGRIESEANIADRPGQMDRLMGIAGELRALARAAAAVGWSEGHVTGLRWVTGQKNVNPYTTDEEQTDER